ncbi:EAL domain-containing protein [Zwartia sp.]|uniref:sensor domain-containing protein n=1 Tax=Zwartia sp. TaxID=2978004 RepID=UPI002716A9DC|nr:EAL domain-containing protein [Zwartia sp.]MDO9024556.1 EAL domain-containing protein [Zwartia sp.]
MTPNDETARLSQYAPLESRATAVQFMESIPVGIYVMKMDNEGNPSFSYVSDRFLDMLDLNREAVLKDAASAFNCVHPDERAEFVALNQKVFKEIIPFYWEGRCIVRNQTMWVIAESIPRRLDSGTVIWEGSCTNITKQKNAELQLKKSEAHIRSLLDNSPVPTAINSMNDGTITYLNQSFSEIFGYTLSDIPTVSEWAIKAYPNKQYREDVFAKWNASVEAAKAGNQKVAPSELSIVCKDGSTKDIIAAASFMDDMLLISLIDITERKLAERAETAIKEANEEKIRFLTHFDPLTNLPNRDLCKILLQAAIDRAKVHQHIVGVLLIDIDHFKVINKNYAYATGDQVLSTVAARIRQCIGEYDSVCRLLSDEFVVIISNAQSQASVENISRMILSQIAEPILVGHDAFNISGSIGATEFPSHGQEVETLLQNAELAISQAKTEGLHNTIRIFAPLMREQSAHRAQTVKDLHVALKQEDFVLHYQPQIDLHSGRMIGVEALLRWNVPGAALRLPSTFISIAEKSHLIVGIGAWVFRQACRQLSQWQQAGLSIQSLGINLSAIQFSQSDIVALVESVLRETGVDPRLIDLELTESAVMNDETGEISDKLNRLNSMGLKLSVDDFGTGYSSLTYLKRFPVERLKIDQSFVQHITTNKADRLIVESIIKLAQSLGITSIAEGVEDEATLRLLKQMGCTQAQGYLIARPMPAEDIERLFKREQHF